MIADRRSADPLDRVTTMEDAVVLAAASAADLDELCGRLRTATTAVLARGPDYEPIPFGARSLAYTSQPCDARRCWTP